MRRLVVRAGAEEEIELDSAGTGGWHVGEAPDPRARAAARSRGIALEGAARQVEPEDFERFDLIVAMDRSNLANLRRLAPDAQARAKIRLLREFDPALRGARAAGDVEVGVLGDLDVPDPYYEGAQGFEIVLDLVEAACEGLLAHARASQRA